MKLTLKRRNKMKLALKLIFNISGAISIVLVLAVVFKVAMEDEVITILNMPKEHLAFIREEARIKSETSKYVYDFSQQELALLSYGDICNMPKGAREEAFDESKLALLNQVFKERFKTNSDGYIIYY